MLEFLWCSAARPWVLCQEHRDHGLTEHFDKSWSDVKESGQPPPIFPGLVDYDSLHLEGDPGTYPKGPQGTPRDS